MFGRVARIENDEIDSSAVKRISLQSTVPSEQVGSSTESEGMPGTSFRTENNLSIISSALPASSNSPVGAIDPQAFTRIDFRPSLTAGLNASPPDAISRINPSSFSSLFRPAATMNTPSFLSSSAIPPSPQSCSLICSASDALKPFLLSSS